MNFASGCLLGKLDWGVRGGRFTSLVSLYLFTSDVWMENWEVTKARQWEGGQRKVTCTDTEMGTRTI